MICALVRFQVVVLFSKVRLDRRGEILYNMDKTVSDLVFKRGKRVENLYLWGGKCRNRA